MEKNSIATILSVGTAILAWTDKALIDRKVTLPEVVTLANDLASALRIPMELNFDDTISAKPMSKPDTLPEEKEMDMAEPRQVVKPEE